MANTVAAVLLSVCIVDGVISSAFAEEPNMEIDPKFIEARDLALPASYVWFNKGDPTAEEVATNIKNLGDALGVSGIPYRKITVGGLSGFLIAADVNKVQNEISSAQSVQRQFIVVEPNPVLVAFQSECADASRNYSDAEMTEWGVKRVWAGADPTVFTDTSKAVWIIDSGVSNEFGAELNLVSRLNCLRANCPSENKKDKVGHGTMTAGIIGAATGGGGVGVRGIVPSVAINSMRVVRGRKGEADLDAVAEALNYLKDGITADNDPTTPTAGDVINLSYGALWTADAEIIYSAIEQQLRDLADLGFRISLAAGNADVLKSTGYVQSISPARAGGYRATAGGGVIMTASAIDETDKFWEYSAFGNYFTRLKADASGYEFVLSLPDFAEPGVNIVSLWPGLDLAKCSGTSFAAAHLSGILLYGPPTADGKASMDKSAEKVGLPGQYDDTLKDPIGKKP